jgi:hypothetical protein
MLLCWFCPAAGAADEATFYFLDVALGNATFVVTPAGHVMLLDCGTASMADRVVRFARQNGIQKIDYLVTSHFEEDHMGGAARIAQSVPIVNWVDHGEDVTYGKDYEWWKAHRTLAYGPPPLNLPKSHNAHWDEFRAARAKGHHIVVKGGDKVAVKGFDVTVLTALGKVLSHPLKGAGAPNPACATVGERIRDDAEDGQSVGVLLTLGKFRFVYLSDLTWSNSNPLFCPDNKVGAVDAYIVTHHAYSPRRQMGDYYWGLSCCSPAETHGLRPRVAFLSLRAEGHPGGDSSGIDSVRTSPGLEDLWQTEKILAGGEKDGNSPDDFIANIGGTVGEQVPYIKMVARADGSFTVTNSRNGFTKQYPRK